MDRREALQLFQTGELPPHVEYHAWRLPRDGEKVHRNHVLILKNDTAVVPVGIYNAIDTTAIDLETNPLPVEETQSPFNPHGMTNRDASPFVIFDARQTRFTNVTNTPSRTSS